jgi:hypothetical protein
MRHLPSYRATITSKERVDIYSGQEAASVNKALKTDMVVRLAAGKTDSLALRCTGLPEAAISIQEYC